MTAERLPGTDLVAIYLVGRTKLTLPFEFYLEVELGLPIGTRPRFGISSPFPLLCV